MTETLYENRVEHSYVVAMCNGSTVNPLFPKLNLFRACYERDTIYCNVFSGQSKLGSDRRRMTY